MASLMTPLDFAKQYMGLQTYFYQPDAGGPPRYSLQAGWKTLKVVRYRLGASIWGSTLWQDISKRMGKSITVRVKTIVGATEDVTLSASEAWSHFRYPFVGKGSPEQAQIAIQLTYRYHKSANKPEEFVIKDFIGLDCNGFVGNYLQRAVRGQGWRPAKNDQDPGPTTLIGDLLGTQGKDNQMTEIKDLKDGETYILGHCTPDGVVLDPSKQNPKSWGHVMITQPGTQCQTAQGLTIGVVEATAAGNRELRYLDYTFLDSKKKTHGTVFRILRGSPKDPMDVRIARLKV
jgi:hypothetical protein